ncbi:MAG: YbaK/EbsC family protein [Candidatus Bathyarchaeota archaeon]|nr:YbaK/EbsC family protein [Candidatus Bathyarchaeota archaeon]MDH5686730.1 YbaK/EbsC family protein [Candidatus Bathyarchaeota archaeon]
MNEYEEKLKAYIRRHNIGGEHLSFKQSCHTVKEAARAADADIEDFVKNICMIDAQGSFIVAIVKGEDRASTSRVGKALGIDRPRIAEPEEILEKTGYPCGGVPSFGYKAAFLIDPKVMMRKALYTSGGSENSLVRISSAELQRANNGRIVRIRK